MARDYDHLPLWAPMGLMALSIAAGAFTLSTRHGSVARAAAETRVAPVVVRAPARAPAWVHPKLSRFFGPVCGPGVTSYILDLALTRMHDADQTGEVQVKELDRRTIYVLGQSSWSLHGNRLAVTTARYVIDGTWSGSILTATTSRAPGRAGGAGRQTCRFHPFVERGMATFD